MSFFDRITGRISSVLFSPKPTASSPANDLDIRSEASRALLTPLHEARKLLSDCIADCELSTGKLLEGEDSFKTLGHKYLALRLDLTAVRADKIELTHPEVEKVLLEAKNRLHESCKADPQLSFDLSWKKTRKRYCDFTEPRGDLILSVDFSTSVNNFSSNFRAMRAALIKVSGLLPDFSQSCAEAIECTRNCEDQVQGLRQLQGQLKVFRPVLDNRLNSLREMDAVIVNTLQEVEKSCKRAIGRAQSIVSDFKNPEVERCFLIRQAENERANAKTLSAAVQTESPNVATPAAQIAAEDDVAVESEQADRNVTLPDLSSSIEDRAEYLEIIGVPSSHSARLAQGLTSDEICELPRLAAAKSISQELLKLFLEENPEAVSSHTRFTREIVSVRETLDQAYKLELDPSKYASFHELVADIEKKTPKPSLKPEQAVQLSHEQRLFLEVHPIVSRSAAIIGTGEAFKPSVARCATQILCFGFSHSTQIYCNATGIELKYLKRNTEKPEESEDVLHALKKDFEEALGRLIREGLVIKEQNQRYHLVKDPPSTDPLLAKAHSAIIAHYRNLGFRILTKDVVGRS